MHDENKINGKIKKTPNLFWRKWRPNQDGVLFFLVPAQGGVLLEFHQDGVLIKSGVLFAWIRQLFVIQYFSCLQLGLALGFCAIFCVVFQRQEVLVLYVLILLLPTAGFSSMILHNILYSNSEVRDASFVCSQDIQDHNVLHCSLCSS